MRSKLFTVLAVAVMAFLLATNPMVSNAAGKITGKQIKNGSITGKDIKNHSITASDVTGSIAGPTGPAGPQGAQGAQGKAGSARAYAIVDRSGTVSNSTGNVSVNFISPNIYCVTIPGIAGSSTAPQVTPNHSSDDTSPGTGSSAISVIAEIRSTQLDCPATASLEVITFRHADTGSTPTVSAADEGFALLVP